MESIILILVLAALFVIFARRIPDVKKEIVAIEENGEGTGGSKMNKFESSESFSRAKRVKAKKTEKKLTGDESFTIQDVLDKVEEMIGEKKYDEAEKMLIGIVEIDPTNPRIYSKLGVIYLEQDNFGDSKEAFKTAIKYDKDNDLLYNNLGLALFNQGRYVEAIEAYEKSIRLNGTIPHRYINLGLSYAALRQYEKALNSYKKALVLDKDNKNYQELIEEVSDRIAELKNME